MHSDVGYNNDMRLKPLLFFAVVGCLAASAIYQELQGPGPTLQGAQAPDFALKDSEGEIVRLSDYRGNLVFLNFWATWCGPCIEELPAMMELNQAFAGRRFEMLGISFDTSWDDVNGYLDEHGFELSTVLDPGQSMRQEYRTTGVPETFLVDGNGTVVKKYIGAMPWSAPNMIAEVEGFLETVEKTPITQSKPGGIIIGD